MRRVMLATVLVAVVMATGAIGASADTPIVACQNRYTGQLRVISPTQSCLATEVRHEFQSFASAEADEAALQQQLDDLAARVEALEGRMDTAEGDIDALEGRATALEDRATTLEGRMDTAEGDIDNLEGRMNTAEGDIDVLGSRATNVENRVTTAEVDIITLDTRVTNIRDFFTGVANQLIGCFTDPNADFLITIPALVLPAFTVGVPDLFEITVGPFEITPEFTVGFPVFNATTVVGCISGITTATGQ